MKEKVIFALGFFDGVHLGHRALLEESCRLAAEYGCVPGVVTFTTHPEAVVAGAAPKLINTIEDRCRLFVSCGVSRHVLLPFDDALRNLSGQAFLERLVEAGAVGFVCGDDFRFGYRGEGDARYLKEFCKSRGLACSVVPGQSLEQTRVSSTHIRALLESGEMAEACRFLGHPHLLTGTVVTGKQLGRTIGVPTANLLLPEGVITPRFGVYACTTRVEGHTYVAVTNIGTRPTVEGEGVTVEAWLLDFSGDLYGKELSLNFHSFLRPEQKFDSLEQLQSQIREDAAKAFALLK